MFATTTSEAPLRAWRTFRRPAAGRMLERQGHQGSRRSGDPSSGRRPADEDLRGLNLLGESPAWRATLRLLRRIADGDATTLIEGETGTGKELVARALHALSGRRDLPFIPVNCGALPDNLLEAELFGHEKGAFTDAQERREGLVAKARGGTLFLDEVEAMT